MSGAGRSKDMPPNSRLFVICGKGASEDAFREAFGKYGHVEDVWVVKDRRTNEDKGVVYVKMAKTSEAALAMEELNGKRIPDHHGMLRVVVASNKSDGSRNDAREEEKTLRLFVIVPKSFSEEDLTSSFQQFGDIDYCHIVTDKNTGENKGFAYVKFKRPYHAALAFEGCDASFKPKFADPPRSKTDNDGSGYGRDRSMDRYGAGPPGGMMGGGGMMDRSPRNGPRGMKRGFDEDLGYGFMNEGRMDNSRKMARGSGDVMDMMQNYPSHGNQTRLQIVTAPGLSNAYLARLCNIIPGLEYCDLNENTGMAYVRYSNPQYAAYARDKLDGLEYPIGTRLMVRFPEEGGSNMESKRDMYNKGWVR